MNLSNNTPETKTLNLGAIEIKTDKCYIDGKATKNPVLIGLAVLDFIEHNSEPIGFKTTNEMLVSFIKSNNLRQTSERTELLKAIHNFEHIFNVEDLFKAMLNRKCRLSRATIYNALNLFFKAKIIIKSIHNKENSGFPINTAWFELNPEINIK